VRLIEVKGNNDIVRSNQQELHEALRVAGISVEVVYEYPPIASWWPLLRWRYADGGGTRK
jgi:hypothetical protein